MTHNNFFSKNVLPKVLIICFGLFSQLAHAQQYMDDTTFVGTWKFIGETKTGVSVFERCNTLEDQRFGFSLDKEAGIILRTSDSNNVWIDYPGTWWSLSIGHFNLMYYDSTRRLDIIAGFEYALENDKTYIQPVYYEEQQNTADSGFDGFWVVTETDTVFSRQDSLEAHADGFELSKDETSLRRLTIQDENGQSKQLDLYGSWWSHKAGYFDMQYYIPELKTIIIEGYEITETGETTRIKRVRFDQIHDQ